MKTLKRTTACAGALTLAMGETVFAHEEAVQPSAEIAWNTWVLLLLCAAAVVLAILYAVRKKRHKARMLKTAALLSGAGAVLMAALHASGLLQPGHQDASLNLIHVHGLAYNQEGGIILATHDGLKLYQAGKWSSGPGEHHDYMGFAASDSGYYSSGHPAEGSKLPNPIGLVKTTDGGQTLKTLGLQGQVDFHLLAVSAHKAVLYGYNAAANAVLKQPGLYVTRDEGKIWTRLGMSGFAGEPTALAVHPDNGDVVALGGRDGLYLSVNGGQSFEKLLPNTGVSALSFESDGMLTIGGYNGTASLVQMDLTTRKTTEVSLPQLKEDAVAYTARNPRKPMERIITTYNQDVFLTSDGGTSWVQLAVGGKTKSPGETLPKPAKKTS